MSNISNKPAAAPKTENPEASDPTLRFRRIITWAVSALLGGSLVALAIKFFLKTEINATVPISFVEVPLLPLAAIPMTFFFLIWLDILFKAKIIND